MDRTTAVSVVQCSHGRSVVIRSLRDPQNRQLLSEQEVRVLLDAEDNSNLILYGGLLLASMDPEAAQYRIRKLHHMHYNLPELMLAVAWTRSPSLVLYAIRDLNFILARATRREVDLKRAAAEIAACDNIRQHLARSEISLYNTMILQAYCYNECDAYRIESSHMRREHVKIAIQESAVARNYQGLQFFVDMMPTRQFIGTQFKSYFSGSPTIPWTAASLKRMGVKLSKNVTAYVISKIPLKDKTLYAEDGLWGGYCLWGKCRKKGPNLCQKHVRVCAKVLEPWITRDPAGLVIAMLM